VIEESGCGVAVERGDVPALAAAAVGVGRESTAELVRMGASGRRWVEKRHTWSAVAAQYVKVAAAMRTKPGFEA
jgi:glycosyltransferase involved in cell wall biosynthesis